MSAVDDDPTILGWEFNDHQLWKAKLIRGEMDWIPVLPFEPIPEAIYRDEDGEIRGFRIRFRFRDRERVVVLPASLIHSPSPSRVIADAGGPDISTEHARWLVRLLADVAAGMGVDITEDPVVTRAEWVGHDLSAPGVNPVAGWNTELAAYGIVSDIDENKARELWQDALTDAVGSSKSMIVMGMPIGSMYVRPLELDNFALHITSESSQGKTESAEIAMSAFGDARKPRGRLYRTWDVSEQAPIALFRQVGCMPVWFDETAVLGDDTRFSTIIFRLAQGTNRMRADAYGGLTEGSADRWDTCLLSTGEARITITSALSGMQRRVLEIAAPLTDMDTHGKIQAKVRQARGWPMRWLVSDPDVEWAQETHREIFGRLSDEARSQQVEVSQAANIATCAMGFAVLCRLAGLRPMPRAIIRAATDVFRDTLEEAADRGADIAERGLNAIKAAMNQYPDRFLAPDEGLHERWGVVFPDQTVGIVSDTVLKDIFARFGGAPDPMPTMRRLRDMGRVVAEDGRLRSRRKFFMPTQGMVSDRIYVLNGLFDDR